MRTITLPYSGHLLLGHLAAYGLAAVLHEGGRDAFVDHDPDSQSFEPRVATDADDEQVVELIRRSAARAQEAVDASDDTGRPVIWARATLKSDWAASEGLLSRRQALLEQAERDGDRVTVGLLAGLGASAAWRQVAAGSQASPADGASALDGVMGNSTSDFVRGVARRSRPVAAEATVEETFGRWSGLISIEDEDKTNWGPPGTRAHPVDQWLAALGLGLLPVAHRLGGRSETPCCWGARREQGVTLPVLGRATSVPRLRALLRHPRLSDKDVDPRAAADLQRFGIRELVRFRRVDGDATSAVVFSFARGERIDLA
jgi:hypothetical protein